MSVPFQIFAGNIGVVLQAVDDTGHASGHGGLGVGHAVAHGVAGANLHRDSCLPGQLLQLIDEGHHEAVEIGAGDILQMAAGHNSGIEGILHHSQVVLHALAAVHLHLIEDVIVGAGHQNTRLPDAQILHQLEVLLAGANPCGDLRELQIQSHAPFQSLPILLAVDEELRLADDAIGAAQPVQQLVDLHNLVGGVGLHGLLAVPEGGIGDPDLLRHGHGHPAVVEGHLGHGAVGIHIPLQVGLGHILQRVFIGFLFQQVGLSGNFKHTKRPSLVLGFNVYNYTQALTFVNTKIPIRIYKKTPL